LQTETDNVAATDPSMTKSKPNNSEKFESISVADNSQEKKYDLIDSFNHIFKKKIATENTDENNQVISNDANSNNSEPEVLFTFAAKV
jgi:capsular polysaccharide biosynthesis protein